MTPEPPPAAAHQPPTFPPPAPHAPPEPPAREPDSVVKTARAATLGGLIVLTVLGLLWELWLARTGSGTLALKVVPLLFCVAGLWRHRMYTFRWLSLLVWLYVLEGTVRATTESGVSQLLATAEVVLSLWLFCWSALYIRWRLRHAPPAPPAPAAGA